MTLRQFVIDYPLPTGVLTEAQRETAFKAFCAAVNAFMARADFNPERNTKRTRFA